MYIDVEEYKLKDHKEPANYRDTLSNLEYDERLKTMNAKMQSMKDNHCLELDWTFTKRLECKVKMSFF